MPDRHDHANHGHGHDTVRLASAHQLARMPTRVHRIGRRRFLTELGRSTFAVAILGGFAAACSNGDDERIGETGAGGAEAPTTPATTDTPAASGAVDDRDDSPATTEASSILQWAQVSLGSVSAYVLVRGNQAAVVDTGNPGSADQIGDTLAMLGATYDDVRHVVLTHRHGDHVGSLPDVADRAGASAIYAGAADIDEISSSLGIQAVGDGDDVFGLQVIETPGHTPGSISLLDTGIGLLVAGDSLNGNAEGTGISGPNERYTTDMAVGEASVTKLAGFDFDAAVFGHGNPVTTGAGDLVAELAEAL